MNKKTNYINIRIRKKPWYIWLIRIAWMCWLIFWIDITLGSRKEMETQAYTISLIIFLVSFFMGVVIWLWRNFQFKKGGGKK